MGNSRAGVGGGSTLRDIEQRSGTTKDASAPGATTTRRGSRLDPADKKTRRRRRARRLLVTSAIIGAGFVAGLIGGMISGIA